MALLAAARVLVWLPPRRRSLEAVAVPLGQSLADWGAHRDQAVVLPPAPRTAQAQAVAAAVTALVWPLATGARAARDLVAAAAVRPRVFQFNTAWRRRWPWRGRCMDELRRDTPTVTARLMRLYEPDDRDRGGEPERSVEMTVV